MLIFSLFKYHRKSYSNFANVNKVERAKKRYAKAMDEGEASIIRRKAGRPSVNYNHQTSEGLTTKSKSEPFLKGSCITSQVTGGSVSKVEFEATGKHMLEVLKKLQDKGFFRRSNEITLAADAVANDVVYHNRCWANARSKVRPRQEKDDSINHNLSEIEVLNIVQTQLKDPDQPYLDINIVNEIYKEMLLENSEQHENIARDYKKKLKDLLLEFIPEAIFVK